MGREDKTANLQYEDKATKPGYYTVHIRSNRKKIPYVVYATSDYHAARLVRHETGFMASQYDVEGPYQR